MDAPRIFLSYARADRGIAERLRDSLEKHGCVVHDPAADGRLVGPRISVPYDDLKEAARGADQFVLLFGKHRDRDQMQEQEWQAALEASWDDAAKKMIPVLVGNAELPSFVRGAAGTGRSSMGLHVNGLGDAERAAEVIARTVGGTSATTRSARGGAPSWLPTGDDQDIGTPESTAEPGEEPDADFPPPEAWDPDMPLPGELLSSKERTFDRGLENDGEIGEPGAGYSLGVEAGEESGDQDSGLVFTVEPPSREEIAARFAAIRRYAQELKS